MLLDFALKINSVGQNLWKWKHWKISSNLLFQQRSIRFL